MRRPSPRAALVAGALAYAGLLATVVFTRIVNADEGIFLQAARRVAAGDVLYRDVFFMQMPLTAYAFAPAAPHGWAGFFALRLAGALMSAGVAAAVAALVRWMGGSGRAAALAAGLFALNGLVLAWHPLGQTTVWSDGFGVLGLAALAAEARTGRARWAAVAGALLGLAALARLTHVLLVAVAFGAFVIGRRGRAAGAFAGGAALALTPAVVLFALDPFAFWMGNVGFRGVWGAEVAGMPLAGHLRAVALFVLYPQNAVVLALAAWGWRRRTDLEPAGRRVQTLAAAMGVALFAFYTVLRPAQMQYFVQTLPFALVVAAPALARVAGGLTVRWAVVGGLVYAAFAAPFAALFVGGVRAKDRRARLPTVAAAVAAVERCAAPADTVLGFNQHVPVLARRPALPGMEVGGVGVVPHLTPRERAAVAGLFAEADLRAAIAAGRATVVVREPGFTDDGDAALRSRYVRVWVRDSLSVWARRGSSCALAGEPVSP